MVLSLSVCLLVVLGQDKDCDCRKQTMDTCRLGKCRDKYTGSGNPAFHTNGHGHVMHVFVFPVNFVSHMKREKCSFFQDFLFFFCS